MGSPGNGLLASALIAVTPVFARWASTGYTDVPAALYVGLTAIFVGRWWQTGTRRTLLLAGVSAGLAMWTKNSTLTLLLSLTWLLLSRRFLVRPAGEPRLSACGDAGALLAGIGLTAAPWYLRNVLEFGLLVPPTVLTDRASHSLDTFTVMLRRDQQFGISGWLFTAAILYGSMTIVARGPRADRWYAPMALLMPFLAAWWWFASYEARFLVTVIPLLAAMSASMIDDVGGFIRMRLNPTGVRVAVFAIVAVIIGATAVSVRKAVEHKAILVHQPWLDNDERHRVRVGGLYDLAVALSGLPPASRVGGVPPMARYYLDRRRFARLEFATQRAAPSDLAHDYDYVVYEGLAGQTYAQRSVPEPLMRTPDGYVLFATKRQSARAAAQGRSADR
jgi:hypothetical protein